MSNQAGPFSQSAIEINRTGQLSDDQRQRWRNVVSGRRQGVRGVAYVVGAIGILLLIGNGPASKAATREATGVAFLTLSLLLIVIPAVGIDAVSRDVNEGRLLVVEGAIGKQLVQSSGRATAPTLYIIVADQRLRVISRAEYNAAPDAGFARAFYFPRSRRLVNLEMLPDRPLPSDPRDLIGNLAQAVRSHDLGAINAARADAAALMKNIEGPLQDLAHVPSQDAQALSEGLCGSWRNPIMTLTFSSDGTLSVVMLGQPSRSGHWSTAGDGRLVTDVTGRTESADARLHGDQLTIAMGGRTLAFTRVTK